MSNHGESDSLPVEQQPLQPASVTPPFPFSPSDEDLVAYYLKRKVQNKPLPEDLIGEVDLYKYEPWDLPPQSLLPSDSEWYFFTCRPRLFSRSRFIRYTAKGYWEPTGNNEQIRQGGKLLGFKKTLLYFGGRLDSARQTVWSMHEYQLEDQQTSKDKDTYVLCRIVKKVSDVGEEHGCLPIDSQQVAEVTEPLQISYLVDGSLIFGRENEKKSIVNMILSHVFNNNDPIIICMVADSGFGKSTMLHLIYNDQSVDDAFDSKVFLCMTERFDERMLMQEVLKSLMCPSHDIGELCASHDIGILEYILMEELMKKKLLLVLDNANNQNQSLWNYVSKLINAGCKGSLALVTRHSQIDGHNLEGIHMHHLSKLSTYHCWAILKHHAFGGFNQYVNPELEKIGNCLLSKCNSNPFCVRVLGALLNHSVDKEWWINILESDAWKTTEFGADVLPAFRVSYAFMPTHLKSCFSYCSLFPREYIFPKHYIIRLWISQGFIVPMEGRELEDIGIEYFDELVRRSFFLQLPVDDAKIDKFVMHEIIHYLAENVSCDSCLRSEDSYCSIPDVSHLSLAYARPQTFQLEYQTKEVRDLRTCLFINRSKCQMDEVSPIFAPEGLSDFFGAFSKIITLDLSYTSVAELPNSIGILQSLRFLGINDTKIKYLPRELCSLVTIQTIEARNCSHLAELPKEISQLANLQCLDVWKESGHVVMPIGIGRLINLRKLETFNIGNDFLQSNVGELKNLSSLRNHLQIAALENVRNIDEAIEANLKNKSKIEVLTLEWSSGIQFSKYEADIAFQEELLRNLEPNYNLKELIVKNYIGGQFPSWVGDPLFSKLISIILDSCLDCKIFPDLSELPFLKNLSLRKIRGVQKLISSDQRSHMKQFPMFPSLELLNLWEIYDLSELFDIRDGDFPHLHTVSIHRCSLLREVPRVPSLVKLSFHSCVQLPEIAGLPSLGVLKIENLRNIKHLCLPPNLPVLKRLELSYCNELLSIEGLLASASIEKILLIRCPKFKLPQAHELYLKRVNITRELFCEEIISMHCFNHRVLLIARPDKNLSSLSSHNSHKAILSQLEEAEKLVMLWDSSDSLLFESSSDVISLYLFAVDDLITISSPSSLSTEGGVDICLQAEHVLQLAMFRLGQELHPLLIRNALPADAISLSTGPSHSHSHSHSQSHFSLFIPSPETDSDTFFEFDTPDTVTSTSSLDSSTPHHTLLEDPSLDLIHPKAVSDLQDIADRMIRAGYAKVLVQVYCSIRKDALNGYLSFLGVDRLGIDEVVHMVWRILNEKIKKWVKGFKIIIQGLLSGERRLCDNIFASSDEIKEECFVEITKGCILQLLKFGDAVASTPRSAEKLFAILDMYLVVKNEVLPELRILCPGELGGSIYAEADDILKRLGDAAKGTLFDLGIQIQGESSRRPIQGGDIHPLTRYVMNYTRYALDYSEVLEGLLVDDEGFSLDAINAEVDDAERLETMTPYGRRLYAIMSYLESNLQEKSNQYEDDGLQCIFLMNNICYMYNKAKDSELGHILGDHWLRQCRGKIRQNSLTYLRVSWTKVLSCLRIDNLSGSSSGGSGHTLRKELKERFKIFNCAFEELYRVQRSWKVPDPHMREDIKISILEQVIPAYRTFLRRYGPLLQGSRNVTRYIKYTTEDLESHISELFEGLSDSENRPKKRA